MDECLSFSFVHFFGIAWITVLTKLILTHHPISAHSRVTTSTFSYNNIIIIIIIIIKITPLLKLHNKILTKIKWKTKKDIRINCYHLEYRFL